MRNRFFFDGDLEPGQTVLLSADEAHHARVVRVRALEEVEVFNGRGGSFEGTFEVPNIIHLTAPTPNREPASAIHLAMAIINLEKFELVLQKATELGVASIIPLVTERCEVRPERYRGKAERWEKIIFEAVKQCGRSRIPSLETPAAFEEVVARSGGKVIFEADATPTTRALADPTTLLIGPEGGWSEREIELARQHDCAFQQLGPRRLRAETAAIVAIALTAAQSGLI
jgi:16S rRNA (uracil1498-N3)-methyltransferase